MQTIDVTTLAAEQSNSNIRLIDVRTPVEFRSIHAVGATNHPLESLDAGNVQSLLDSSRDQPLYVICKSGGRSSKAAQQFMDAGHNNVINVTGGTDAWHKAGLPVSQGKKAVSLERQVRMVAGFLVLLGALLSFVHPGFVVLSGFIGAGLLFAGITDTCGMGMMLAKMPWNQCSENNTSCST